MALQKLLDRLYLEQAGPSKQKCPMCEEWAERLHNWVVIETPEMTGSSIRVEYNYRGCIKCMESRCNHEGADERRQGERGS